MNKENREYIISKLKPNKDCIMFCLRIDKNPIVNKIQNTRKIKKRRLSNDKIYREYNNIIWDQLKEKIGAFLVQHHIDLTDVVFQCDHDCVSFVVDNNLRAM